MTYIVCCHQPDLFPWLGFFSKLSKSHHFILLDHVSNNPKDAQNWVRRVKISDPSNGSRWLSLPILKTSSNHGQGIPLVDWHYNIEHPNWFKSYSTILQTYSHYPYYSEIDPIIHDFFYSGTNQLSVLNFIWITALLQKLNIQINVTKSSSLNINSSSNQMLLDCIKYVGGTTYLSGDGAAGYFQVELFDNSGIDVEFNRFKIFEYNQPKTNNFIGGLSIIDAVASCGFDSVRRALSS